MQHAIKRLKDFCACLLLVAFPGLSCAWAAEAPTNESLAALNAVVEPDAVDAAAWYADTDEDTFGDADAWAIACAFSRRN